MIHRKIYTESKGCIKFDHNIHHIDGNNKNNDISNLISIPIDLHAKYHKHESNMVRCFKKNEKYGFEYHRDMMIMYYYQIMDFTDC